MINLADSSPQAIEAINRSQQSLVTAFTRYLSGHQSATQSIDRCLGDYEKAVNDRADAAGKRKPQDRKLRDAKTAFETYAAKLKSAMEPFAHARWLHDHFPDAQYTDVIGLCKLATKQEVAAQDYSLNPGRYVGVVIEEDGKTEEEFRADLVAMNAEFETLDAEARQLAQIISHNIRQLAGAE